MGYFKAVQAYMTLWAEPDFWEALTGKILVRYIGLLSKYVNRFNASNTLVSSEQIEQIRFTSKRPKQSALIGRMRRGLSQDTLGFPVDLPVRIS